MSVQDIRPNPQDTSNFYLANIYQTIADPNRSNISSSFSASAPQFSPPNYAVWVNSLWFLSLVISLTCALLATLLQQWARRYLKVTHSRYSPHKRARIRAFFAEGVEKILLPWAVETLPALLHTSLFLFFAGLVVFLCNVNLTIFKFVLSWVSVCTVLYGFITFIPIFRHDSLYYTPLSLPAWHIVTGISFVTFRALRRLTYLDRFSYEVNHHFEDLEESYRKMLVQGMRKTAEESALDSPSEIDTRAFLWTFDSLDEDHELERFFSGLPGFRNSKVVDDPLRGLTWEQKKKLSDILIGFLGRTFSSDLLPEPVKRRRATVCAKALDPAEFPNAYSDILIDIVFQDKHKGLQTAEFGRIVRGWGNSEDHRITLLGQATASYILVRAQRRDDSWFILASSELGIPETVLRDYATHGDSLSLAILIHITRQQFNHYPDASWPLYTFSKVLEAAPRFNVQGTSPELRHEFCALWNQIVREAQNGNYWSMAALVELILGPIRNVYITLHQGTDSAPTRFSAATADWDDILREPSSYPLCNVAGHVHDDFASPTFARTIPHNNNPSPVSASLASPEALSSSVPAPCHVVESLTHMPPLDNFHPAHQTTTESLRNPVTSPDLATAGVTRDIVTSAITIPYPTPETSTSTPPLPAVSLQHNPDLLVPSGFPNLPSSDPVLNNILPIGPPLPSPSTMTQSDLSPSFPQSHRSIIVTTSPSVSPGPTSAPDLGTATKGDRSPKPGLGKEEDALDPPSESVNRATHANTMATLDFLPQLSSVTDPDVAIAGPSLREPDAGRTRDHPPDPPHCRYDIV